MGHVLKGVLQLKFNRRSEKKEISVGWRIQRKFHGRFSFHLGLKMKVDIEQI